MQTAAPCHWMLVLNGKSAGDEAVRAAVTALRQAGVTLDVRVTWEGGDAQRYADEAIAAGVHTLVAGGGDGTLSEVATALARHQEPGDRLPALALLPLGTANDFASAAGIPTDDPLAALNLPLAREPVAIDLLRLDADGQTHWAANLASGGAGTQVTTETNETLKKLLGGLAYVITGLGKLANLEAQRARIHGPGFEWHGDFIALGVGNGRQAGGGQALCPDARIDDALLDLTIVPPLPDGVLPVLGQAVVEGKQAALEEVALRAQLPWIEIEPAQPLTLNLDGEPVTSCRFRIECVPGRLRMHLPADCPLRAQPATVAA